MEMTVTPIDGGAVKVAFDGRMDVIGVGDVESQFTATVAENDTVVDMTGVTFIASMGIRMFVAVTRPMRSNGRKIAIFGLQEPVKEVLDMASMDQIVPIFEDEASARAAIA